MGTFVPDSVEFRRLITLINALRQSDFMPLEMSRTELPDREAVRGYVEWLLREGYIRLKQDGVRPDSNIYVVTKTWDLLREKLN